MDTLCLFVVSSLKRLRELYHLVHCIRLEKFLVIEMLKEDVKSLLRIFDLGNEGARSACLNADKIVREYLVDGHCLGGDMCTVTSS